MNIKIMQLRLASCVEAIVTIQDYLDQYNVDVSIIDKFKSLEEKLKAIDTSWLTESDVERVEHATNNLLREMEDLYAHLEDAPGSQAYYH